MERDEAILDFWFGDRKNPSYGEPREAWFKKEPEFDATLRRDFLDDHERAAFGHCDGWMGGARRCLALVIALDQFPRNIFRNTPRAFAADAKALATARYAIAAGYDRGLLPVERLFLYIPFEHAETLADQERSVALFGSIPDHPKRDSWLDYAVRHRDVVARFGRFPHRNAILGRASTAAELEFLTQPNSSF
ncbi:MAG: DUF924 domain-containing protein [Alphaproteobacteria bacterium]|nr:DUF924 domain-containing protein [Alphaproteobacteria bacterium]